MAKFRNEVIHIQFKTIYDSKTQEKIDDIELQITGRKAYFFDSALLPNVDIEKIKIEMEHDSKLNSLQKELADVIAMAVPKYVCIAETEEEKKFLDETIKQYKEEYYT